MASGTYQPVVTIGGATTRQTISKTADHPNNYVGITLPAATALSTASFVNDSDGTGTGTLDGGHGLVTGDALSWDLYWATGVRYGITATITTNAIDFPDTGAGDALPATATECTLVKQVDINTAIDGDAIKLISLNSSLRSHIHFIDVSSASIYPTELIADEPQVWHDTNGLANPYTGNPITAAVASNGETSGAATLDILCLEDSTP